VKTVPKDKIVYGFSPKNKPVEHVKPGELVLLKTEDAFGGQINSKKKPIEKLDWTKVDGATGPLFVQGAQAGDTLVVETLDIKIEEKGVIATIPKSGILGRKEFKSSTKIVEIKNNYVHFDNNIRVRINPMIGTIGVAPESGEIPSGSLGKHGGNMDVKELVAGTKLYLPVFTEGALFAAGDVHAIQADGELCVSSVEVAAEALFKFGLIKGKKPEWPILETRDEYALLACGETLEEATESAAEAMVNALMREHKWAFEEAYMFGSLAVDLRINQVVDPKKGARAAISKKFITIGSLLE
jgi:amidase